VSNFAEPRLLTLARLIFLLREKPDLMPNLSEGTIRDKSKASGFGRTIVCLQAVWFCTQIIVCVSTHLTISVLELNTFAHALCTLLIYFFWWDKSLDVTEPTMIPFEAAPGDIAMLYVLDRPGFLATGYSPHRHGLENDPYLCPPVSVQAHFKPGQNTRYRSPAERPQEDRRWHDPTRQVVPGFLRVPVHNSVHGFSLSYTSTKHEIGEKSLSPMFKSICL
jgi:hypothetical protein